MYTLSVCTTKEEDGEALFYQFSLLLNIVYFIVMGNYKRGEWMGLYYYNTLENKQHLNSKQNAFLYYIASSDCYCNVDCVYPHVTPDRSEMSKISAVYKQNL